MQSAWISLLSNMQKQLGFTNAICQNTLQWCGQFVKDRLKLELALNGSRQLSLLNDIYTVVVATL